MKTGKSMARIAGAALLLLTVEAGVSYGALPPPICCSSGDVKKTGSGYFYSIGTFTPMRSVRLSCDNYPVGPWWTAGERTFLIPATPDKDGIYAAALTAIAADKKVDYCFYSTSEDPYPGTTKGQIKLLEVIK